MSGYLSDFHTFNGYKLPTCVGGGSLIGTGDYLPFFKANITDISFPKPG